MYGCSFKKTIVWNLILERKFKLLSKGKRPLIQHQSSIFDFVLVPQGISNFIRAINLVDLDNIPCDPFKRPIILSFHVNQTDKIRHCYWLKRPSQQCGRKFTRTKIRNKV